MTAPVCSALSSTVLCGATRGVSLKARASRPHGARPPAESFLVCERHGRWLDVPNAAFGFRRWLCLKLRCSVAERRLFPLDARHRHGRDGSDSRRGRANRASRRPSASARRARALLSVQRRGRARPDGPGSAGRGTAQPPRLHGRWRVTFVAPAARGAQIAGKERVSVLCSAPVLARDRANGLEVR
jgi:hypothetical protein